MDERRREELMAKREQRRREIEERERAATGGITHIGHLPIQADTIEGWTFRRCRCGFVLAMTPAGRVWWLKAADPAVEIDSLACLLGALRTQCRKHQRDGRERAEPAPKADAASQAPAPRCKHNIDARTCGACASVSRPAISTKAERLR